MSLYLTKEKRYKWARMGDIIRTYCDNMPYQTFKDNFTESEMEVLRKKGFKSWNRKLRPGIVKYIVEDVFGFSSENHPPIT